MDERPSADIIPFPRSRVALPATEALAQPDLARARLMLALASLEAALAGQRRAVASWRGSLGELRGSMAGLGDSMHLYRERLGELGTKVSTLNGHAQNLSEWSEERRQETPR
jgi:hypothetical protein